MPTYGDLFKEVNNFRKTGKHSAALELLQAANNESPTDIRAYLEIANTLIDAGDDDGALAWLNKAEVACSPNFWTYYLKTTIYKKKKDLRSALNVLEKASDILHGRVSATEYTNTLKEFYDVKSALSLPHSSILQGSLSKNVIDGPVLENCLQVSLVKDEADIIYFSLKCSYRSGFRYFCIADNGSTDQTWDELRQFEADHPDCIVYLVKDPIIGYYQAAKTMALVRLAATILAAAGKVIKWIFPLDADEVLYITQANIRLHDILNVADAAGAVFLHYCMYNACSNKIYDELVLGSDMEEMFPFYAPTSGLTRKVAFRNISNIEIEMGNHFCNGIVISKNSGIVGAEYGLVLKHFPLRSIDQVRRKIVNGGRALSEFNGPQAIGSHWRRDFEQYQKLGDNYVIDKIRRYMTTTASDAGVAP